MTDYSATTVGGWEYAPVISYGAFSITGSANAVIGFAAELDLVGNTGAIQKTADNKIKIKKYADTNSIRPAIGIFFRNKPVFSEDGDETPQIGMGSRRRDQSLLHEGIHEMWYASGSLSEYGMRIAPDVSGCREEAVGMAHMGYCLTPGVTAGSGQIKVRLFCYKEPTAAEVTEDYIKGIIDEAYLTGIIDEAYLTGIIDEAYLTGAIGTGFVTDTIDTYVTSGWISGVLNP